MTTPEQLLTWEQIRSWAAEQPEQCPVGAVNLSGACPIAVYLNSQISGEWWVWPDEIGGATAKIHTPTWLADIIRDVDRLPTLDVSREQFLAILDEHKPEEARP